MVLDATWGAPHSRFWSGLRVHRLHGRMEELHRCFGLVCFMLTCLGEKCDTPGRVRPPSPLSRRVGSLVEGFLALSPWPCGSWWQSCLPWVVRLFLLFLDPYFLLDYVSIKQFFENEKATALQLELSPQELLQFVSFRVSFGF